MDPASGEVLNEKIANLDHLNAVINETLRLFPPTPTEFQRYTPPEGITIDGTFIPGNTYVQCPMYVLGRSEEIYDQAEEFIPERWYKYPDMIKEKTTFMPFGLGKLSPPEIRTVDLFIQVDMAVSESRWR